MIKSLKSNKIISYIMVFAMLFNLSFSFTFANQVFASEIKDFMTNPRISGGNGFTIFQADNGTVFGSGKNQFGQLGGGTIEAAIPNFSEARHISTGTDHAVALKSDGTVWAWGKNGSGQIGDGTTTTRTSPVQVLSLTDIIHVAANGDHSLALKSDGTVWAFGKNDKGQLGNDTTTNSSAPVQVSSITNVVAVATGNQHSMAIKSDGTVWAWGNNESGRLGNGATTGSAIAVEVSELKDVVAISGGKEHSLALKSDGTVWSWGKNGSGQLGDGTTTTRTRPVQVSGLSEIVKIATWADHSVALRSDGTIWSWGNNGNGRLGDGTTTNRTSPVQVLNLSSVSEIATGNDHSLAIKDDGSVWAWGNNGDGRLADGTTISSNNPVMSKFVSIQKSSSANLTNLVLSTGVLNPTFISGLMEYALTVENNTTAIDITATLEDDKASMKINGIDQASGTVNTVNLNEGQNIINILITAEGGMSQKIYTVIINRGDLDVIEPPEIIDISPKILEWQEMANDNLHATHTLAFDNKYILVNKVSEKFNVRMLGSDGLWTTKLSAIPEVKSLIRVPETQTIYLVGGKEGTRAFYISRDGGETWVSILNEGKKFPDNIGSNNIDSLWAEDENILYLTVDKKGIYKTVDGGASWVELNGNLPFIIKSGVNEYKIRNVWSINGKLYAGLKEKGGIYMSSDSGITWTAVKGNSGLTDGGKEPRDLLIKGSIVYMATKDGVWYTDLADEKPWIRINGTAGNKEVARLQYINNVLYSIVKEVANSNIYYYEEGILKPFTNKPESLTLVDDFFDVDFSNEYFYVAHKKGLLKIAKDWDVNQWNNISGALTGEEVKALTVLNNGNRYIAGTKSGKLYVLDKETKLSKGWELKASGAGEFRFIGLAPGSDIVYAFGKNSFYISSNKGETWEMSQHALPDISVNVESALLLSKDEIFIVMADKGVYYTDNGGAVWTKRSQGLPEVSGKIKGKVIYNYNSRLYVGMGEKQGVYISSDNGLTWQSFKLQQGLTELGREVKSFFAEGNTFYLGSKDGVWRTTEDMDSWEKLSGEILYEHDVLTIVRKGSSLFALTKKEGKVDLYEANDLNRSFKSIGTKPEGFVTSDAFVGSRDGDFIVIGTKTGSIRVKLQSVVSTDAVDSTIPLIKLIGNAIEKVFIGSTYTDAGVVITGNQGTDLVASVTYTKNGISVDSVNTNEVGTYVIHYNVTDAAGNSAKEVTRMVVVSSGTDDPISEYYSVDGYDIDLSFGLMEDVNDLLDDEYKDDEPVLDTIAPIITLTGNYTVNVVNGDTYTDAGVIITDNIDTGLVAKVTYTKNGISVNSINTFVAGTYVVHYSASDAAGNVATEVTRIVIVGRVENSSDGGGSTGPTTPITPTTPTTPTSPIVVTNTDVNTVVDYIKNASSTSIIAVDVTGNKQVEKDIFDAIKGTNKTVIFTQDRVQWTFKGSDITGDTKAIDMTVKVATLEKSTTNNKVAIEAKVKAVDVMVVTFGKNGLLPGKATVKLKLDESWLLNKDKDNIGVYYYNDVTNNIEEIVTKLQVDAEGYVQFVITHNSDYILTDKKLSLEAIDSMPNGTVVIGNRAFDLAYANNPSNAREISDEIVSGGAVYVKDFSGNWIDNITGFKVIESIIQTLISSIKVYKH